ncbi:ATP-binding protein [Pseudidiomarina taiwanensis]|uniref:histidine kinase n=1 Tax=Pseudidiomarina taiwanensis TaxID=337250 RepID=A0A432ZKT4_9GAMM|nr:ATP-binding protein [Pseudidiomarina taiwanensis]RUO78637.1 histidine kinase [Pseudidiomarina taiwanensis]
MKLSLRTALLLFINLTVFIVLCITAYATYGNTMHELDEVYDAELAQTNRLMTSLLRTAHWTPSPDQVTLIQIPQQLQASEESEHDRLSDGHKYESKLGIQVWDLQQRLLFATTNALGEPLSQPQNGYHLTSREGFEWVGFSRFDPSNQVWVYTGQREDVRSEISEYLALEQLVSILLTWVPISLVIFLITAILLKPVQRFAAELATRSSQDLGAINAPLPSELEPVRIAVNTLFARLAKEIAREQRFVADASHELRTPLAALILHAAQLSKDHPNAVAIQTAAERMTRLVNQLLELARLDQFEFKQQQREAVDLLDLLHQILADLPSDEVEQIDWQIDIEPNCQLLGYPILLKVLLRNLIYNAMQQSTVDSKLIIRAHTQADELVVEVVDFGGGVSDEELTRLGERFYRSAENRQYEGTGLGLSIARRIAQLHDAQLQFSHSKPHGLTVTVKFLKSWQVTSSPAQGI